MFYASQFRIDMIVLSLISNIVVSILVLVICVEALLNRALIKVYVRRSLIFIGAYLLLLSPTLFSSSEAFIRYALEWKHGYWFVFVILVAFLRTFVTSCMGYFYCAMLGAPGYRLLAVNLYPIYPFIDKRFFLTARRPHIETVLVAATAGILFVMYTVLLFKATNPQYSEALRIIIDAASPETLADSKNGIVGYVLIIEAAFVEEIVFRFCLQNYFAARWRLDGHKYWIAVVITTILWTLAHAGLIEPDWVKFAQIAPIGIALGFLFERYGVVPCILAHAIFNVGVYLLNNSGFIKLL